MNKNRLSFILTFVLFLILYGFLLGWIKISNNPLPPLGQFLNPNTGIWANAENKMLQDVVIALPNTTDSISIVYDERHVPHIFATNIKDALFAQGYIEAANRLFQMDFMTRAASSRLSEVLGNKVLDLDIKRHLTGLEAAADASAKAWEKSPKYPIVQAYVDGINAYISQLTPANYPIEYKLLNFEPEPWTVKKTVLIFKYMSEVLANGCNDMESSNMLALLGREKFDLLYPEKEDGGYPVIPYEKKYTDFTLVGFQNKKDSVVIDVFKNAYFDKKIKGVGSNNWAVSGSKTLSGMPILCNDPHLTLSLPSIWFEEQIITPDFNAYGVSFPGFPGIMIGFNKNIAWGETNVGQDVQDLYKIHWANAEHSKYILDGKELSITYDIKEIKINGQASIIDTVKYTVFGPVIKESKDGNHDLTRAWLPLQVSEKPEFSTFIDGMACKNYDEYLAATSVFDTPAQNFLFAANDGEIGLRVNGRFPIRYNEDGRFVKSGTSIDQAWQGFIPREQNPQIRNPKQGYLVSSNQKSAGNDYPYYYTGTNFEHFRNRSINTQLAPLDSITPEDMMQLQGNTLSMKAKDLVHLLCESISDHSAILDTLNAWNFTYEPNKVAPVYFEEWYQMIYENTFDEILKYKDSISIMYPEDCTLVDLMKNYPDNSIFDVVSTPQKENCKDIIQASYDKLKIKMAASPTVQWGKYKPLNIYHYTRIPAFSALDLEVGGSPDAINAVNSTFGPSWRMVVQTGDTPKAWGVYPGGQSGSPASAHYKDMLDQWANRKYFPLQYISDMKEAKSIQSQKIILTPKK